VIVGKRIRTPEGEGVVLHIDKCTTTQHSKFGDVTATLIGFMALVELDDGILTNVSLAGCRVVKQPAREPIKMPVPGPGSVR
jgi:hypothetical protein